jgi:hypothetical protein
LATEPLNAEPSGAPLTLRVVMTTLPLGVVPHAALAWAWAVSAWIVTTLLSTRLKPLIVPTLVAVLPEQVTRDEAPMPGKSGAENW